jgi:hypothetical protein
VKDDYSETIVADKFTRDKRGEVRKMFKTTLTISYKYMMPTLHHAVEDRAVVLTKTCS